MRAGRCLYKGADRASPSSGNPSECKLRAVAPLFKANVNALPHVYDLAKTSTHPGDFIDASTSFRGELAVRRAQLIYDRAVHDDIADTETEPTGPHLEGAATNVARAAGKTTLPQPEPPPAHLAGPAGIDLYFGSVTTHA